MKKSIKALSKILIPDKFRPRIEMAFERLYYFGFRYKCLFCNSHLRTFLPHGLDFPVLKEKKVVGGGYRQNALCPICRSLDGERLLYLYLLHKTDIFENPNKLLHIAPEAGLENILRVNKMIDYLTADIISNSVMERMDIRNIHHPDSSFDEIICNHVLEHITEDEKAMSELYRILKPGGWAILQVPLSQTLKNTYEDSSITTKAGRERAFGQEDHVRIYAEDYQDRLEKVGFKVNNFKWQTELDNFGGSHNVFGLIEEEQIYFVRKPLF